MQVALLQRCGTVPSDRCPCHADRKALMRSSLRPGPSYAPPIVHEVLAAPGERLDATVRLAMQSRLGRDFTQVRLHTGSRAHDAAASVSARAFTVGGDIVFGRGQYAPETTAGASLLTHELAHVAQQGTQGRPANLVVGPADSPQEHEAEALGKTQITSARSALTGTDGAIVHRQPLSDSEINETEDVPDPDLAVQDGSSPVTGLEPIGELPDAEPSSDLSYLSEIGASELGSVFLARAPKGKRKPQPTKAPPKPKPTITEIDVDLGAQRLNLKWSDGSSESHVVSTGMGCPNTVTNPCPTGKEAYCTPTGDFTAGWKGDDKTVNSHGDPLAWFVKIVGGIGIHDSWLANGTPQSHGCIRVGKSRDDWKFAKKINEHVTTHTKVHISGTAPAQPKRRSKKWMQEFHFDGCPDPAPAKPAPTPAKRTPPGRVRRP